MEGACSDIQMLRGAQRNEHQHLQMQAIKMANTANSHIRRNISIRHPGDAVKTPPGSSSNPPSPLALCLHQSASSSVNLLSREGPDPSPLALPQDPLASVQATSRKQSGAPPRPGKPASGLPNPLVNLLAAGRTPSSIIPHLCRATLLAGCKKNWGASADHS